MGWGHDQVFAVHAAVIRLVPAVRAARLQLPQHSGPLPNMHIALSLSFDVRGTLLVGPGRWVKSQTNSFIHSFIG